MVKAWRGKKEKKVKNKIVVKERERHNLSCFRVRGVEVESWNGWVKILVLDERVIGSSKMQKIQRKLHKRGDGKIFIE